MDLLIFDYSLGHSRDMEDDPFLRSTRQRRHDYNSETANKTLISYIHTTLNENRDVTTNVFEDWIPLGNSHFSNNVLNIKSILVLHNYKSKFNVADSNCGLVRLGIQIWPLPEGYDWIPHFQSAWEF